MPPSKRDTHAEDDVEKQQMEMEPPVDDKEELQRLGEEDASTSKPSKTNIIAANMPAIAACSLYSFCSVSMVLTNKSLASR